MSKSIFSIPIISLFTLLVALFTNAGIGSTGSYEIIKPDSGIAAMHITVTGPSKVMIIDKAQNNSLMLPNGNPVTILEYDIEKHSRRILNLTTNTFCSSGSFLGNGSLLSTGGAEAVNTTGYQEGFSALRLFSPCQDDSCEWYEDPKGMKKHRWYSTSTTISDGRVFILGGSLVSVAINNKTINNPSYEFFPREDKTPQDFPFLVDTLPSNLYPIVHLMPGPEGQTQLFIFANQDSIIFDWSSNKIVKKLPRLDGPARNYPQTASSVMLPLRPENNYKPEILICGGNDKVSITNPASNTCGRIDLSNLSNAKWEIDDFGGIGRVMPDAVILADGKVMFLNGGQVGIAGYSQKKHTVFQATDPVFTPVLYDDQKPLGERFQKLKNSTIARLYHSVATLIPDGKVFITGSSPNTNVIFKDVKFPTELRIELFSPPYLSLKNARATVTSLAGSKDINKENPIKINYKQIVEVTVDISDKNPNFTAALVHFGFITHSVHMSQRYVGCEVKDVKANGNGFTMNVTMPPNPNMIAPGPSYLFINNKGTPGVKAVHVLLQTS